MSAGVCRECGQPAPDAHDVTLTMWNGGTAVYFEIGRPEWYKLTCPECVDRLGLDPD